MSDIKNKSNIVAIIVAYNSNPNRLNSLLTAVSICNVGVIVADNSENVACNRVIQKITEFHNGTYICMNGNKGIAIAKNTAISKAWSLGANYSLLLDDDSTLIPGMIERLQSALESVFSEMVVFGARTVDMTGKDISNARPNGSYLTLCRDMNSSGTLISREIFEVVGKFDESLFIDCVDFDWGWRALQRGFKLVLVDDAKLEHRLGVRTIGMLRIPSPIRHYYQYRNVLRLMVRSYTPLKWTLMQSIKLIAKLVLILIMMDHRRDRLKYAFLGIIDAFRSNGGKYSYK